MILFFSSDNKINDYGKVVGSHVSGNPLVQHGYIGGMKAVIDRDQQKRVKVWPSWLDSPSLGTVDKPGTLE